MHLAIYVVVIRVRLVSESLSTPSSLKFVEVAVTVVFSPISLDQSIVNEGITEVKLQLRDFILVVLTTRTPNAAIFFWQSI